MKPCGTVLTYMSKLDWKDKSFWIKLRTMFFNAILFILQLVFMVVGTAIGKIKWFETLDKRQFQSFLIMLSGLLLLIEFNISMYRLPYHWWSLAAGIFVGIVGILEYRCIRWCRVWRAAQCSHVRLVLEKVPDDVLMPINSYWTANFGYLKMEIQAWNPDWNKGKRFEDREPTFEPSDEFIKAMIQYAHDQVGKRYDDYQLVSPMVNFLIWIFWWPLWGKEVIGWFNRPGGLEFCSSGVTACLRWGEGAPRRVKTRFFKVYHTAMVQPCLFAIDENWKPESNIKIQKRYFDRLVEETTGVPDILRGEEDESRTNH